MQESENFLTTSDHVTLYYKVRGNATDIPLILLNGGPGQSHKGLLVASVWDELAKSRTVVFYDQRGTGQSSSLETGSSCTLSDQVADLEALRLHLGVEQLDLLGHSWGGYLGMAYTARHGSRVSHLILVGSAAPRIQDTLSLWRDVFPEHAHLRVARQTDNQAEFQATQRIWRSVTCHLPEKREAYLAVAGPKMVHFDVARRLNADLQQHDLSPDLPKFKQLTLVTTGRYDLIVAPSVAYQIHQAIPKSQFVVFEQSGHRPHFEEPEAFKRVVEQFLSDKEIRD